MDFVFPDPHSSVERRFNAAYRALGAMQYLLSPRAADDLGEAARLSRMAGVMRELGEAHDVTFTLLPPRPAFVDTSDDVDPADAEVKAPAPTPVRRVPADARSTGAAVRERAQLLASDSDTAGLD
jgi:hypothetical protein